MKLKYYLRGLGIGIIVTTIILMIANAGHKTELTDEEIIKRAEALGMVMEEDPLFSGLGTKKDTEFETESENVPESEIEIEMDTEQVLETESEIASEIDSEIEIETETEIEIEIESEAESESEMEVTGETYHLVIHPGMVPRLICNELEENGVIESAAALRQYLVDVGYATSIVVGEYDIPYGATNEEVYQILKEGPL